MNSANRIERIHDVLRGLRAASGDIVGAAILTSDGFIVASEFTRELDEEMVSGMAATLLGVGERIAQKIMSSELEQAYVRAKSGYVIVNAISEEEVLIILTNREAKLGMVFMELRNRLEELSELL